jgi:heat shock protein HtpX
VIFDQIARNQRDSWVLIFFFVLLIGALGWVFGEFTEFGPYAAIPALILAVILSWSSYYYSDQIVLSLSHARPATREERAFLVNTVEGLALAAGIPMPRPYIIDDTAPNAFATGRDPAHAAIVVTTGLLEKLNRLELEGVVAHEMSHIGNYDIRFMMLVSVLVGVVAMLSDWMRRWLWWGGGRRRSSSSGGGNAGLILAIAGLVLMILAPFIASLMRLALSRSREYLADATGAKLTRYPAGLADALEKIDADREPLEVANKATAHLYIANPLKEHGGALNSLFSTHPPIADRVARLRKM